MRISDKKKAFIKSRVSTLLVICGLLGTMASCTPEQKAGDDTPPALYSQPKTVPLNTHGGYKINQFTGESIPPLINSLGDTVITGVPIPVIGKYMHPDSVAKPTVVRAGKPDEVHIQSNVHPVPENLTVIPFDESKLKKFVPGEAYADFVLVNSIGDTLPTGVPIPVKGRVVPCTQPRPVPALPPRMKDKAIYDIQYLDTDQGMISPRILCMLEDKEGNLWFSTWGQGVSRYVGESFVHFTDKECLPDRFVNSMLEDRSGNMWFGTIAGVSCYDGVSFVHFTAKEGLSTDMVYAMVEDKSGSLWFGGDGGVTRYDRGEDGADGATFTHYTVKEGLASNNVSAMFADKSGNLWVGSWGQGVSRYTPDDDGIEGASLTTITEKEGLSSNGVRSIFEDKSGNLWFGHGSRGLTRYSTDTHGTGIGSFTHYTMKEGLTHNYVTSITEDNGGKLWFGTGAGANRFDPSANSGRGSFTHFTANEGLSHNMIRTLMVDRSGNLWFGTDGGGVSRYDVRSHTEDHPVRSTTSATAGRPMAEEVRERSGINHFTAENGLFHDNILSVFEDKTGNMWFGTEGGGVICYNPPKNGRGSATFSHYTKEQGLLNNSIQCITEDKNGDLWFATHGLGVSCYNPDDNRMGGPTFTNYGNNTGLAFGNAFSIYADKSGNLWIGFWGGLVRMDPAKGGMRLGFTHFTDKDGLSGDAVLSIHEDKNGHLWFGTYQGGVSRYDPDGYGPGRPSITHFTEKEGLSDNAVVSIHEDKYGNMWFGTAEGLNRFDGTSFTCFTEGAGLIGNGVMSIIEDASGDLWISTVGGLSHFVFEKELTGQSQSEPKNESITDLIEIHSLDKADGLKSININFNSAFFDSRNQAWFGGTRGLVMFDPEAYTPTTKSPGVHLTQLDIDAQFIDYRHLSDSLTAEMVFSGVEDFSNYPIDLELPYHLNHLTFHFAGIDWAAPQKIRYSYKLEGLNKQWSQPTLESKVDYRNMPYGKYIFKVRAIGESQEWSEAFEYPFIIRPPWWHSWWAYCGYGLLFIASVFIVDRIQRRRLIEKERQKSRDKELEQAKEVEKAYHQLKATQNQLIQSEKMASLGELTAGIAHEIQNPLNFVNNFSEVSKELIEELKAESSKLKAERDTKLEEEIMSDVISNLEKIHHHGMRASSIVKGMLEHSRSGDGQKQLTDINVLADEYLRLAYHGLRAKDKSFNADFKLDLEQNVPKIHVIPQDIGRVLLNLINNAFFAVSARSKTGVNGYVPMVTVQTKHADNHIEIRVKDNADGIPDHVLDKIFQPFFTTKPAGQGTGLGLSLSYDIITKGHNGTLTVETTKGIGTEFIIVLPQ